MKLLTDFTAGELSPRFKGRPDLEITAKGCQELTNFVPFWPGGITMRPGTSLIGWMGADKVRLVPFIVSDTVSYIVELSPNKLRLWRDRKILVVNDVPVEIAIDYADPFVLQFAQLGADLFIAGGSALFRLSYISLDQFDYGPFYPAVGNEGQIPFIADGNYPHCIAFHDGRLIAAATDSGPNVIWGSKTFDYSNFTYFETLSYTARALRDPYLSFQGKSVSGSKTISEIPDATIAKLKAGDRISGDLIPEHPATTKWPGSSLYAVLSSFPADVLQDAAGTYKGLTIKNVQRTSLSRAPLQTLGVGDGIGGGFLIWGSVVKTSSLVAESSALLKITVAAENGATLAYDSRILEYNVWQNGAKLLQENVTKAPYTKELSINVKAGDIIEINSRDFMTFGPRILVSSATILSAECTATFIRFADNSTERVYFSGIYDSPLVLSAPISFDSNAYTNDPATADIFNRVLSIDVDAKSIEIAIPASGSGVGNVITAWSDPLREEYEEIVTTRDVVDEDSAYRKELYGNEKILWLAEGKDLIVGTTTGERILPTGANSQNFSCPKQTAHGSAPVQPVMLNDAVVFVGSDRKSIREYVYRAASSESELYSAPRLDINADHIMKGVVHLEYSSSSTPFVWAVQSDGTLIGALRDRYAGLCAFFRIRIDNALIESIAVIPENGEDTIYLAVNKDGNRALLTMGQLFSGMHLDFAQQVTVANGAIQCPWLDGPAVFMDGTLPVGITVVNGVAQVPAGLEGVTGYAGYSFLARMKSMPIAENPLKAKQIPYVTARVMDSYKFSLGTEGSLSESTMDGPYSGDVAVYFSGSWDNDGAVVIEQKNLPLTVLAILLESNKGG